MVCLKSQLSFFFSVSVPLSKLLYCSTPFGLYRDGTELRGVYYSKPEVAHAACSSLGNKCDYPILLGEKSLAHASYSRRELDAQVTIHYMEVRNKPCFPRTLLMHPQDSEATLRMYLIKVPSKYHTYIFPIDVGSSPHRSQMALSSYVTNSAIPLSK
jgi:hypothetical protein